MATPNAPTVTVDKAATTRQQPPSFHDVMQQAVEAGVHVSQNQESSLRFLDQHFRSMQKVERALMEAQFTIAEDGFTLPEELVHAGWSIHKQTHNARTGYDGLVLVHVDHPDAYVVLHGSTNAAKDLYYGSSRQFAGTGLDEQVTHAMQFTQEVISDPELATRRAVHYGFSLGGNLAQLSAAYQRGAQTKHPLLQQGIEPVAAISVDSTGLSVFIEQVRHVLERNGKAHVADKAVEWIHRNHVQVVPFPSNVIGIWGQHAGLAVGLDQPLEESYATRRVNGQMLRLNLVAMKHMLQDVGTVMQMVGALVKDPEPAMFMAKNLLQFWDEMGFADYAARSHISFWQDDVLSETLRTRSKHLVYLAGEDGITPTYPATVEELKQAKRVVWRGDNQPTTELPTNFAEAFWAFATVLLQRSEEIGLSPHMQEVFQQRFNRAREGFTGEEFQTNVTRLLSNPTINASFDRLLTSMAEDLQHWYTKTVQVLNH